MLLISGQSIKTSDSPPSSLNKIYPCQLEELSWKYIGWDWCYYSDLRSRDVAMDSGWCLDDSKPLCPSDVFTSRVCRGDGGLFNFPILPAPETPSVACRLASPRRPVGDRMCPRRLGKWTFKSKEKGDELINKEPFIYFFLFSRQNPQT